MRWLLLLLLIPGAQACDTPYFVVEGFEQADLCRDEVPCDPVPDGEPARYTGTVHYIVPPDDCAYMPQEDVTVTLTEATVNPAWLTMSADPARIEVPLQELYAPTAADASVPTRARFQHSWDVTVEVQMRGLPNATVLEDLAQWGNMTSAFLKVKAETAPHDAFEVVKFRFDTRSLSPALDETDQQRPTVQRAPAVAPLTLVVGILAARRFNR